MKSGIYLITNVKNSKKYIGKDINLPSRKYRHWHKLKNGSHNNPHLQASYNRHGKESFHYMILERCLPEDMVKREKYWIDYYDTKNPDKGYNMNDPEVGRLGMKLTPEHKAKISASMKGKVRSVDYRANISAAHLGKKCPPETIAKISIAKKGKPWTEARRASYNMKCGR